MSKNEMNQFIVIGLGKFGQSLCLRLGELGKEVLAIDQNEELVNAVKDYVTHSVVGDATDENVLKSLGIRNFDVVCVCMGQNMQASILCSLICKEKGANYLIAKAQSENHKKVLEKIGVDMVVFPEEYMGRRVASMLLNPNYKNVMEISDDYKIIEIKAPDSWTGKSLVELGIRNKYEMSIILIKSSGHKDTANPPAETIINADDFIVLGGTYDAVSKFTNKVLKV